MMKYLLTFFISILFLGCTSSFYKYDSSSQKLKLPIYDKKTYDIKLSSPQYRSIFADCTNNAYTIKDNNIEYGKLFIEHISLNSSCSWKGLSRGFFTYELKHQLKLKTLKLQERVEVKNYEFNTYKVNDKEYVDVIFIFTPYKTTFILDYEGGLSSELLRVLKPEYKYRFLNLPRFTQDYTYSLARFNFFNHYFQRDDIGNKPLLIIP